MHARVRTSLNFVSKVPHSSHPHPSPAGQEGKLLTEHLTELDIKIVYSFPRVGIGNYHKLRGLKEKKFCLRVQETKSPKAKCH